MAVNLPQTTSLSLGNLIQARLQAFNLGRQSIQANLEIKFYEQVKNGMSYKDQLSYRQAQLAKEEKAYVPDKNYINAIKKEIADLKQLMANERLAQLYQDSFTAAATGMKTWSDHVAFLKSELQNVSDPTQKATLRGYLAQAEQQQYAVEKKILDNYYTYAENDRTIPVLQNALSRLRSEKAEALGSGDETRASALTLKEQTLEKAIAEAEINDTLNRFAIKKLKAYNPFDVLSEIAKQIDSAGNTPITYQGVTYSTARDFWETQRANYFNSGQFGVAFQNYYNDIIQRASNESLDALPYRLGALKKEFDTVMNRNDLRDYKEIILGATADLLAKSTQIAAEHIVKRALNDYDFKSAFNKISELQRSTGVDQTPSYFNLINTLAQIKSNEIQQLNQIISDAYTSNDSPTKGNIEASIANAFALYEKGLMPTFSPEEIATKPTQEIVKNTQLGTGSPSQVTQPIKTPTNLANYQEGDVVKLATSPVVYKVENGTLRPISRYDQGAVSEAEFKTLTGKTFSDVKTIQNLADTRMQVGSPLVIQASAVTQPTNTTRQSIKLSPSLYDQIRTNYKVGENNFSTFFEKKGTDIYLKGSAPIDDTTWKKLII